MIHCHARPCVKCLSILPTAATKASAWSCERPRPVNSIVLNSQCGKFMLLVAPPSNAMGQFSPVLHPTDQSDPSIPSDHYRLPAAGCLCKQDTAVQPQNLCQPARLPFRALRCAISLPHNGQAGSRPLGLLERACLIALALLFRNPGCRELFTIAALLNEVSGSTVLI